MKVNKNYEYLLEMRKYSPISQWKQCSTLLSRVSLLYYELLLLYSYYPGIIISSIYTVLLAALKQGWLRKKSG